MYDTAIILAKLLESHSLKALKIQDVPLQKKILIT